VPAKAVKPPPVKPIKPPTTTPVKPPVTTPGGSAAAKRKAEDNKTSPNKKNKTVRTLDVLSGDVYTLYSCFSVMSCRKMRRRMASSYHAPRAPMKTPTMANGVTKMTPSPSHHTRSPSPRSSSP